MWKAPCRSPRPWNWWPPPNSGRPRTGQTPAALTSVNSIRLWWTSQKATWIFPPFTPGNPPAKSTCYIVIAGDRGLAGGYNVNLFKYLEEASAGQDFVVLPIGKKAVEYAHRRKLPILTEEFAEIAEISVADCFEMASLLCSAFKKGEFGHIELCFTSFVSMLSQVPEVFSMLPLTDLTDHEKSAEGKKIRNLIWYEPNEVEVFNAIVPEYLAGLIYGGVCESVASELAARRTAMEAATSNAEDMIDKLNLYYNRARQASITQEITEIVGGAEGL